MVSNLVEAKKGHWRFSYHILDTFRVPGGRVRFGVSADAEYQEKPPGAAHCGQNPS